MARVYPQHGLPCFSIYKDGNPFEGETGIGRADF